METLTEKGMKVFRTARRSRSIAAELYRLRCEGLADTQVARFEKGEPQQQIILQGIQPIEVVTIESALQTYERFAARTALARAKSAALAVANEKDLMVDGNENPVALKVFEKIEALITGLDKDDEDDANEAEIERDNREDDEAHIEFAVATDAEPKPEEEQKKP